MALNVNGQPLSFAAEIDDQGLLQDVEKIKARLNSVAGAANNTSSQIENFAKKASSAIAAYATLNTATNLVRDIARVRGEFQQLEVAFKTMLGSKEKADKLLAEATALAAKTPFTLADVGQGAKQLLAYGFAADTITDTLTKLGNIASGVGAPLNDIVYLYGTLRSTGRATLVDINQFAGRGIPIWQELEKVTGKTNEEIRGMISNSQLGFPIVEEAFKNMTSAGGQFFNLMQEQSKTLTGLTSNLSDAWDRMLNDIGKSNEGIFTNAITGLTTLVDNYKTVLDVLGVMIATYGSYRAAVALTTAANIVLADANNGLTISEALKARAFYISDKALKALNATMLTNPATILITSIGLLASAMYLFSDSTDDAAENQKKLNDISNEAQKSIVAEKLKLETLLSIARDTNKSLSDRETAMKKIRAISPDHLNNLKLETINSKEATKAIQDHITALENEAKAKAANNALVKIEEDKLNLLTQYASLEDVARSTGINTKSKAARDSAKKSFR